MTFIKNFATGMLFFVAIFIVFGIPATALAVAGGFIAHLYGPLWGVAALLGGVAVLGGLGIAVTETVIPTD